MALEGSGPSGQPQDVAPQAPVEVSILLGTKAVPRRKGTTVTSPIAAPVVTEGPLATRPAEASSLTVGL